jgi:hypothetical protein
MTELATPPRTRLTKRLRQVLVLMHLTTAFGWLAASLAVLLLTVHGMAQDDPSHVFATVAHLDDNLLADFSFMTVYTGLMLAGLGHWGYLRFWWVTVKMVLAITCALTGRALFSGWLADAATPGHAVPDAQLVIATILMVCAIAIMAWIGRTKPWGRVGTNCGPAQPLGHPALYLLVIVTPVLDYVTNLPLQAIPVAIVIGYRVVDTYRGARSSGRRPPRSRPGWGWRT